MLKKLAPLLVFVLTTIFYIYTLLPSLAWGDGVKLQSEAIAGESFVIAEMPPSEFSADPFIFAKVGVAAWDHPLYIMLGHLLVKALPFIDALWLVNFISALFGAASVTLVFVLCYRFTESTLASGYAAFSLAVSHTFWWHSSTPEVYTLFVFLLLMSFTFFDQFERKGKYADLTYSGFFLGLAASTHLLAFLAIPALGLYFLLSKSYRRFNSLKVRTLLCPLIGFLAGFSIYIIQFARMLRNFPLDEIMGPVVGTTFLSQLTTLNPLLLGKSLLTWLFLLIVQFSPFGVILGIAGIRSVFRNGNLYLIKVFAYFMVYMLFGIFYQVTDQFAFFLSSYVFWAILMGIGAQRIFSTRPQKISSLAYGILALIILGTPFFYGSLPALAKKAGLNDAVIGIPQIGSGLRDGLAYYMNPNKHGDFDAYNFAHETLIDLPPNSIVIAEWYTDTDEYFVFRYYVAIAGFRPDVTVLGWPTQDPFTFDSRLVLQVIEESVAQRPIYLASLSEKFYAASKLMEKYCIVPESNLYRLYPIDAHEKEFQCMKAVSE